MTIEYPWYFFRLVRPRETMEKLKAVLEDPATLNAVGEPDPQKLVEHVRDTTDNEEIWIAACKLFPLPGQPELFGFDFDYQVPNVGFPISTGIVNLGPPAINMVNPAGAETWVRTYRAMVHDWCAAERAALLAAVPDAPAPDPPMPGAAAPGPPTSSAATSNMA